MVNMDEMRDMNWVREQLDKTCCLQYRRIHENGITAMATVKENSDEEYHRPSDSYRTVYWYVVEHTVKQDTVDRYGYRWAETTTRRFCTSTRPQVDHLIAQITHAMQSIAPLEDWKAITRDK